MTGAPEDPRVVNNPASSRFELADGAHIAVLEYRRSARRIDLIHTEVPEALRGRGIGDRLARAALDYARNEGLHVVAVCPFVRSYLRRHPDEAP